MNFYDFHIGDYASRTGHLEPMEDLAYRRMLDLYYIREAPLPQDPQEIAKLIRMRGEAVVVESVLKEFFTLTERGWEQAKCEEVVAAAQERRTKAQASANKRWHSEGNASALPPQSEGNAPSPTTQSQSQKKPPKPPKGGEPEGFEEFYAAYPKKQGRQKAAEAFAKAAIPLATLLEALEWQREQETWTKDGGKYVPMPASWLNGKRWQDQRPMVGNEPSWKQSRSGVEGRARQLGIDPWDEIEQWPVYLRRVVAADRGGAGGGLTLDALYEMGKARQAA